MITLAGEQQPVTGVYVGVSVSWDDRTRGVLRMEFARGWTVRDLDAAGRQMEAMIAESGCAVGVIMDMANSPMLPDNLIDHVTQIADFRSRSPRLDGVTHFAVLNSSQFGKVLFRSFTKINPSSKLTSKVTFVSSLDEARRVLEQYLGAYN